MGDKERGKGSHTARPSPPARGTRQRKTLHQRIDELEKELSTLKQVIYAMITPMQPQLDNKSTSNWCGPPSNDGAVVDAPINDLQGLESTQNHCAGSHVRQYADGAEWRWNGVFSEPQWRGA